MIFLIAPSGGNNSYISLKLIGQASGSTTTYHDSGSHSDEKKIINILHYEDRTPATKVVISENYNTVKHLITNEDTVIQNYIDQHRELLLLNWFHKNLQVLGNGPVVKYGWRDSWIEWQTGIWEKSSKQPIVSAVAEWLYKLFKDDFADIKRIPDIDKVFNWSVMYETPQATVDEFKKIGYNYTVEEHNEWLQSQEKILNYWSMIKDSIDDPLALDDDVHKGIALALHGRKYDLVRQQAESKFNLLP